MSQPTREEFEEFKQEIRQQIKEQITEEIKAARVIIVSEDALKPIDDKLAEQSNLLKSLNQKFTDQNELLKRIDTKQDDHGRLLKAHSEKISTLQTAVSDLPTKEELEALLIRYLQPKPNGH